MWIVKNQSEFYMRYTHEFNTNIKTHVKRLGKLHRVNFTIFFSNESHTFVCSNLDIYADIYGCLTQYFVDISSMF